MNTTAATKVIRVFPPDLDSLPLGKFKYCSKRWLWGQRGLLGEEVMNIFRAMEHGLKSPLFTFIHLKLSPGELFGHGRFHKDGFGLASETHRLLTFGGTPTEGKDGEILSPGYIWEFRGDYEHRARPTSVSCDRLLLRVSQSDTPARNGWEIKPGSVTPKKQSITIKVEYNEKI